MSYIEYVTAGDDSVFDDPLEDLAKANGFTMEDLAENREGRISAAQRSRLVLQAIDPIRYSGGAFFGVLFLGLVIRTFVPSIVISIGAMIGAKYVMVLFGSTLVLCFAAFVMDVLKSGQVMLRLLRDLHEGDVEVMEGHVYPSNEVKEGLGMDRIFGQKQTKRWYVIDEEYFPVSEEAVEALPERGRFLLYHTPRSRQLLSIEPVRG